MLHAFADNQLTQYLHYTTKEAQSNAASKPSVVLDVSKPTKTRQLIWIASVDGLQRLPCLLT